MNFKRQTFNIFSPSESFTQKNPWMTKQNFSNFVPQKICSPKNLFPKKFVPQKTSAISVISCPVEAGFPWGSARLCPGVLWVARVRETHKKQWRWHWLFVVYMDVSKNRGTLKWMVYNGKPYYNGWFGGTIIFGNTHIWDYTTLLYWDHSKPWQWHKDPYSCQGFDPCAMGCCFFLRGRSVGKTSVESKFLSGSAQSRNFFCRKDFPFAWKGWELDLLEIWGIEAQNTWNVSNMWHSCDHFFPHKFVASSFLARCKIHVVEAGKPGRRSSGVS